LELKLRKDLFLLMASKVSMYAWPPPVFLGYDKAQYCGRESKKVQNFSPHGSQETESKSERSPGQAMDLEDILVIYFLQRGPTSQSLQNVPK
jgi:hypothetical protein